ncbi:hypothetical protein SPOG_00890 [Schizosaccharomyces cryophilus OY26]|uniref:WD-like domain-containing protein n=1 Tax=Schizosaccharomyces cryophilus (strain OY26 / ATCC MYA-4695 / CBS 11777 / NBRC 106824 / NRRL Y48691) TaxID=653667 RepID=S9WZI0_SCHCR|nr:uncharacterized protein SPOG_00890 [Schizosaccharomyces cryophilus OY26]EPY50127.1 hypothetical protein SPOG_00890 [Schizosaccharomyces cryophilus OY26]
MMILLAFASFIITLANAIQINSNNYDSALNLLANSYADGVSGDDGIISHSGIYSSLYDHNLSQFNYTLYFVSGDNFDKVNSLLSLASQADEKGLIGDLVYLAHFASAGGYNDYMQLKDDSHFATDLLHFIRNDTTVFTKLSKNTSNEKLKEFFENLSSKGSRYVNELEKRYDGTFGCSTKHAAPRNGCYSLDAYLSNNPRTFVNGPRSFCYQSCCASWSADCTVGSGEIVDHISRCLSHCTGDEVSCLNKDTILNNVFGEHFCTSGRAVGCK